MDGAEAPYAEVQRVWSYDPGQRHPQKDDRVPYPPWDP
jgi:hypothetical protein